MIRGTRILLPRKPDTRPAFLLPHYLRPPIFTTPITASQFLLKAAVVWGFIGMFRFETYSKLGIHNLVVVGKDGREHRISSGSSNELIYYFKRLNAVGFYFQFTAKYHPVAHAFFSSFTNISNFWAQYCPVKILLQMAQRGLLTKEIFPKKILSSPILSDYLRYIAGKQRGISGGKFTPHSLRIGGHTFYTMKNMDADFTHFLGRRAISRVGQLYYRARAYDNIVRLNMFFRSLQSQHILQF